MSENKNIKSMMLKYFLCYVVILLIVFSIVYFVAEAGEREKLWNKIMVWINFGILAFFYARFAHKPLVNFLRGEGNRISEKLQSIEAFVNDAISRMEAESDKLKNINDNLAGITESIIAAGNREKENVIEKAKAVANKMIESAKKEAAFKMEAAKKRFSEEMLEAAIKITADSIRQNITKEDDEKLIAAFSSDLGTEKDLTL